jgi:hypothetical protein
LAKHYYFYSFQNFKNVISKNIAFEIWAMKKYRMVRSGREVGNETPPKTLRPAAVFAGQGEDLGVMIVNY